MAFYIQKPSVANGNVTVYYSGGHRWTDDASQKITFASENEASSLIANNDGKNGGWTNATVISE